MTDALTSQDTLVDLIADLLERPAHHRLGFYDRRAGRFATHAQAAFARRAMFHAADLVHSDVRAGDHLIITSSTPEAVLTSYLASIAIGATPVVVSIRPAFDPPEEIRARLERFTGSVAGQWHVLTDVDRPLEIPGLKNAVRLPILDPKASTPARFHQARAEDIAHLQLTSGSTGDGKLVALPHRAVVANLRDLIARCELTERDTLVSWLPLYHDMGLVGFALLPMAARASAYFMTPFDFLADPVSWLRGISGCGATMTSSPTFGYERVLEHLTKADLSDCDLSRWRRAYCGAEPVDAEVLRRFASTLAPYGFDAEALIPCYGLAEATLMATMPRLNAPIPTLLMSDGAASDGPPTVRLLADLQSDGGTVGPEIVSVGPPADGLDVWIEDADGGRVDEDLVPGEVVIWGDSVAAGYLQPDGTLDAFTADEGLHTGDLGFMYEGELYVIERLKNIIIRHGVNYSTVQAERTLAELADVPVSRVLVLDSDLTPGHGLVTAVVEAPRKADPATIIRAVEAGAHRFELPLEQLLVVKWGSMPTTTSGKKQHSEVRRRLRDGELKLVERVDLRPSETLAEPDAPVVIDLDVVDARHQVMALIERLATERGTFQRIGDTATLTYDLGFDSLCLYELAVGIEDVLDIRLAETDLPALERVQDVLDLAESRRSAPLDAPGISEALTAAQMDLPQLLNVVEAQKDRQVLIGGRWVTDFASCNYLGLDLHPWVIGSIEPMVRDWGVHPSWTRAVASPAPYRELEGALAELVGVPDTVVFPTVTLLHFGVIPRLVERGGTLLVDREAHHSMHEAADLARARGATVVPIDRDDPDALEAALAGARGPRFVLVDGVYSMAGSLPDLHQLVDLAERYDAQIYVDDAHGFGVLGESPSPERPYGHGGNGIVAHLGLTHDRVIYVAGLSKAYSSMAAFITARTPAERATYELASTLVFSGPIPTASLASAIAGLEVNRAEGDLIRDRLHRLTAQLVQGARSLGFEVDNVGAFPIVNVIIGPVSIAREACDILWDFELLITPAVFPAVPLHRSGLRFTLTAANTVDEVDRALAALAAVRELVERTQLV
ncbi:MAG: aminotransferase class I/II-fold pyridoxal phosphate-dependent enzyme [Acidimicrobiales bacterium]|nr:aminotransferase class I/II-fold pyridoxal phosphate-dependent enzyme [Acidimicrobiales bacterium]